MDIDLEPIPEEEPEEVEPEAKPENEPAESAEPDEEPDYILPFEQWMDPNFVPEDGFLEEPIEGDQDEVPVESGDINHPIEIEAEPESSEEQTVQGDLDSDDEESDSEWTPMDPRVKVRPAEDPRMETVMRTLEQIENLLGQQTQARAATIAQAAEAADAVNNHENQGQGQGTVNRPMHQLVEQFIKLKPPKFSGKGDLEAAPRWVEELEKDFEVLECTDNEKVTLAVYQLQDNANNWWKATGDRILPEGTARTWTVFTESFYEKYFSASARERKLSEFMRLRQGQMSVDQYEAEFARLSKFAPRMVEHPDDKARRFRDGLKADICSQLLLVNWRTYEEIFDRAQILERDQVDRAAAFGSRFVQGRDNPQESSAAEHEPEPEGSQAEVDPMDIDLEPIPEEEPEEVEPEAEPENEPAKSAEPDEEPDYILPFEQWMDPNFVPEDGFLEEPVEGDQDEVPAELGDINHPIEIEAEPESSEEQTVQGDLDSDDEESDSEWTPSKGRRG
ncbi:uncharacterized protein LOC130138507 [Syzygium oleosum]|uniref:uncharacterized protein LOC130138507 n=1 Tax=Syzygium oleosum TaxID=219896 RepID=UPI0024B99CD6|nr:uncharacterized protein LOC130138507 [Syzygium oleosum]